MNVSWLEHGAMRADGIEVAAADMAEWDEVAAAFQQALKSARRRAVPLPDPEEEELPLTKEAAGHDGGREARTVVGEFVRLFRVRYS